MSRIETDSSPFPVGVVAGLAYAMSTGGIARAAVPVISSLLIADLRISASQFGFSVTIMIAAVAFGVPVFGQLADRVGARAVLLGRGAGSAVALFGVASAETYLQLLLFQLLLGVSTSGGVPASNRMVAEVVPRRFRGLAVGTKQSGATAGVLVAGLLIPAAAVAWGWRWSVVLAAGISLLTIPAILFLLPRSTIEPAQPGATRASWRGLLQNSSTRWLSAHGYASGIGISMVFSFLPLYGVQVIGLGPAAAGSVLSAMSVAAIAGRVSWGRFSDLSGDPGRDLRLISGLAVLAVSLISLAPVVGTVTLWLGACVAGLSMEAWNSLAGSALLASVPVGEAGRASSIVQLAFMAGNATGPVLFGTLVDMTGDFTVGWILCAALFAAATAVRYRPEGPGASAMVEGSEIVDRIENS